MWLKSKIVGNAREIGIAVLLYVLSFQIIMEDIDWVCATKVLATKKCWRCKTILYETEKLKKMCHHFLMNCNRNYIHPLLFSLLWFRFIKCFNLARNWHSTQLCWLLLNQKAINGMNFLFRWIVLKFFYIILYTIFFLEKFRFYSKNHSSNQC